MGRSVVMWPSKTQTKSAFFSIKAKYYLLSSGTQVFLFLFSLMKELGIVVGPGLIFVIILVLCSSQEIDKLANVQNISIHTATLFEIYGRINCLKFHIMTIPTMLQIS